jgi:hypothetical protein|tara:strand:- start:294 stop:788 length:495 start_codon:yes stop_codon:yes gene_type:complete
MTKVAISTCHICIEELEYNPNKIQKKCCSTKAFICNECWDKLKENEIKVCPLCKENIQVKQEIKVKKDISCNLRINSTICKTITILVAFEFLGFCVLNLIVYGLHSKNTTFKKEMNYLYLKPIFLISCFMTGVLSYYLSIFLACVIYDSFKNCYHKLKLRISTS